jgi:hypothetical protein
MSVFKIKYFINIYYFILNSMPSLLNPANAHVGGMFPTSMAGASVNAGNMQFGATGGSAAALRNGGGGLYSVTGGNGSPSTVQTPLGGSGSCGAMKGGGKRRRHSGKRSRRNKRSRSSKKYARKRSLKYRMKHRRSRSRSRTGKVRGGRAQAGGYHQYMGNTQFTLGYRTPGFALPSTMSALANPAPFMPYNTLTGGR